MNKTILWIIIVIIILAGIWYFFFRGDNEAPAVGGAEVPALDSGELSQEVEGLDVEANQ